MPVKIKKSPGQITYDVVCDECGVYDRVISEVELDTHHMVKSLKDWYFCWSDRERHGCICSQKCFNQRICRYGSEEESWPETEET